MYFYHWAFRQKKSHELLNEIVRRELHEAGFDSDSPASAWEKTGVHGDTVAVVTAVPLEGHATYVHVLAMSEANASADHWAATLRDGIKNSKLVLID